MHLQANKVDKTQHAAHGIGIAVYTVNIDQTLHMQPRVYSKFTRSDNHAQSTWHTAEWTV